MTTTPASPNTPASPTAAPRALVVGESLIDVVRRLDGTVDEHPGGSPMNVAIGLGRLGRPVDLLTWFGPDARGTALRDHIAESAVHVVDGSDSAAATSVAVATLDETGAATYTFDLDWQVPPTEGLLDDVVVVHSSTIGAALAPGGAAVLDLLSRSRASATVTYDPNVRPALLGDGAHELIERLVALADVVKVSDEDLAWYEPAGDAGAIAADWASRGPGLVVVTRGSQGVLAVTSAGLVVEVPSRRVVVADTVGAGDSFMSGLIDGLWTAGLLGADRRHAIGRIDEATLVGILDRCSEIAGITVSRAGANPPWAAELTIA